MNFNIPKKTLFLIMLLFLLIGLAYSQEKSNAKEAKPVVQEVVSMTPAPREPQSGNITLDFKDADIRNVLKVIAYKAGVNIVANPEVAGTVSMQLVDVPWQKALDIILKTYGLAHETQGNIVMVAPIETMTQQKQKESELAQIQPVQMEVFTLKYLEAQDAKKALEPQLSSRGKIAIMEMTGQGGWEFGGIQTGKRTRKASEEIMGRSKTLIVTDIPPVLERIKEILKTIDSLPQQILIETKIIEVNHDKLRDIGFDFGTGSGGAESTTITQVPVAKYLGDPTETVGGHLLESQVSPSGFSPKATAISGILPYNAGIEAIYKKLTGTQFEVIMHALEEDVKANILSAPHIIAMNNQEASILVGTKYPILKSDISSQSAGQVITSTLDYYQDIGIQLNVVPQISGDDYINMIVHPAVTSTSDYVGTNRYPIIQAREAETRVVIKDGETIVIGGLTKDIISKSETGIPFLRSIPGIGKFFQRNNTDTEKVDLMIFITARIIKEADYSREKISVLQTKMGFPPIAEEKKKKAKVKK